MSKTQKSLCVFCGSREGNSPIYARAAEQLGRLLARQSVRLVYGGGGIGLMGIVARSVLAGKGEVVGVVPRFLREMELALRMNHPVLTRTFAVGDVNGVYYIAMEYIRGDSLTRSIINGGENLIEVSPAP